MKSVSSIPTLLIFPCCPGARSNGTQCLPTGWRRRLKVGVFDASLFIASAVTGCYLKSAWIMDLLRHLENRSLTRKGPQEGASIILFLSFAVLAAWPSTAGGDEGTEGRHAPAFAASTEGSASPEQPNGPMARTQDGAVETFPLTTFPGALADTPAAKKWKPRRRGHCSRFARRRPRPDAVRQHRTARPRKVHQQHHG